MYRICNTLDLELITIYEDIYNCDEIDIFITEDQIYITLWDSKYVFIFDQNSNILFSHDLRENPRGCDIYVTSISETIIIEVKIYGEYQSICNFLIFDKSLKMTNFSDNIETFFETNKYLILLKPNMKSFDIYDCDDFKLVYSGKAKACIHNFKYVDDQIYCITSNRNFYRISKVDF